MSKKGIRRILTIMIAAFIGAFIGYVVYQMIDFNTRPGFYQTQSAPWYAGILLRFAVTAIAVGIASGIRLLFRDHKN